MLCIILWELVRMLTVMMKEAIFWISICCQSMLWFEYVLKKSSFHTKYMGKPQLLHCGPTLFILFFVHAADVVCSCNTEIYAKAIYIRNEAYNTLFFILLFSSFALHCCPFPSQSIKNKSIYVYIFKHR